jgi:dihydrofolate synthase / folylpolyglutamate synthase
MMTGKLRLSREMTEVSLEHWLERLETLHPTEIELGLDRAASVAEQLDLLDLGCPVVTVAGTNGKGSVVAVVEAVLLAQGRRVGAFTSPHLQRFNERIRVGAKEVSDAQLIEAFEAIESARGKISLTYFEFSTLAALYIFRKQGPDVAILEVGLGGRLDAVNIVDPSVSVITAIDMDHESWLGDSREKIALEKAGILRSGVPVVVADRQPPESLRAKITDVGARPALFLGDDFDALPDADAWQGHIQGADQARRVLAPMPEDSLLPDNIVAGLQAVALLGIDFDGVSLPGVIANAAPQGRRQVQTLDGLEYVFDVAHNPASICKLTEFLAKKFAKKRKIAVFSAMADKDLGGMIAAAEGAFDAWFVADQPDQERAASADDLAHLLRSTGVSMISVNKNVRQALARAKSIAQKDDVIIVFGSFFTVGKAVAALHKHRKVSEAV